MHRSFFAQEIATATSLGLMNVQEQECEETRETAKTADRET